MYKAAFSIIIAIVAMLSFFNFGSNEKSSETSKQANVPKEWKKFNPATGKFSVFLPSTPKYAIDIVNVPKTDIKRWYEMYVSEELNGTVYLINLITYHPGFDLSDVKGLLHNVVNEIASSNLNNHVEELKDTTFQGKPALYFHLNNHSIEVKGMAFLSGATVYLLTYTSREENFDDKEFNQFINSFELLKENADSNGDNKNESK